MKNPSTIDDLDSDEINPWALWQNSLSAKYIIVGQDWGPISLFKVNGGKEPEDVKLPTNEHLATLVAELHLPPPILTADFSGEYYNDDGRKNRDLFFTNALLCLKGVDDAQGSIPQKILNACVRNHLTRLITIIQPKSVIALGNGPFQAIARAYHIKVPLSLKEAVKKGCYSLPDDVKLFPVYHCGARGVSTNRNLEDMHQDWRRIREIVDGEM